MTNYFCFIPYPYKLGLIRTLVDRAYKINNTWLGFYEDIKKLTEILKKNLFPAHLVERVVNRYLTLTRDECDPPVSVSDTTTNLFLFSCSQNVLQHLGIICQTFGRLNSSRDSVCLFSITIPRRAVSHSFGKPPLVKFSF